MCAPLVRETCRFLDALAVRPRRARGARAPERPFVVNAPTGRLFAVLTRPRPRGRRRRKLCVVLLTRPRSHRNRMWIEGARRLAAQGFATIRVDYHGCGRQRRRQRAQL
jgi:hypothetical protein